MVITLETSLVIACFAMIYTIYTRFNCLVADCCYLYVL